MSDRPTVPDLMAALEASLERVRVKLWICPNGNAVMPGLHRVEWDGDLATCLDCGQTSGREGS